MPPRPDWLWRSPPEEIEAVNRDLADTFMKGITMNIGALLLNTIHSPVSTALGWTPLVVTYLTSGHFGPAQALDWRVWVTNAAIAAIGSIQHDWTPPTAK